MRGLAVWGEGARSGAGGPTTPSVCHGTGHKEHSHHPPELGVTFLEPGISKSSTSGDTTIRRSASVYRSPHRYKGKF